MPTQVSIRVDTGSPRPLSVPISARAMTVPSTKDRAWILAAASVTCGGSRFGGNVGSGIMGYAGNVGVHANMRYFCGFKGDALDSGNPACEQRPCGSRLLECEHRRGCEVVNGDGRSGKRLRRTGNLLAGHVRVAVHLERNYPVTIEA